MLKNYKELKVWQKSYELCLELYGITAKFSKEERYGPTSQIRRSVVSISSNIAAKVWKKDNHGLHQNALHILWFCLRIGDMDIITRGFRFH